MGCPAEKKLEFDGYGGGRNDRPISNAGAVNPAADSPVLIQGSCLCIDVQREEAQAFPVEA